ncbi:hypothetical protein [Falsiroseomonas sp. E2-1-a4]
MASPSRVSIQTPVLSRYQPTEIQPSSMPKVPRSVPCGAAATMV